MPRKTITSSEVVSLPAAAPKTAAKAVKTAAKAAAPAVTKVAKPRAKATSSTHKTRTSAVARVELTAQQIADRAYFNWLDRGCPVGTPEEDWFRAETELLTMSASA